MDMKTIITAASATLLLVAQCPAQTAGALITVTNPASVARRSETVEVHLRGLIEVVGKNAEGGVFSVTPKGSSASLLSQAAGDDLLFQSDFAPGETKEFAVRSVTGGVPPAESRVAGMFVLPREDYAWENDRIAFRMYGPALAAEVNNGIDVWTKRVRSLIVAKWYKEAENAPPGKDPYHADRGEGADFFDVGRSLGAGGSCLWDGGKVHQPGVFSAWKTLSNGPLRTEFELTYHGVSIAGVTFIERTRISLDAGDNLNRVSVTFEGPETGRGVLMTCGLVKRAGTRLTTGGDRSWMGLWGRTNSDSVNGSLGTGVVFPAPAFVQFTEDSVQHLLVGRAVTGTPLTYYAGAGWTRSGDFGSAGEWNAYLENRAARIAAPLRVSSPRPIH
jgi:unsaturated rhamnogalacturonyl hydrolase